MEITNLDKGEDYNEVSLKDYRFINGKSHVNLNEYIYGIIKKLEYKLELFDSPTSLIETKSVKNKTNVISKNKKIKKKYKQIL